MIKELKEMQKQNIFKMISADIDLDNIISSASEDTDIEKYIPDIKRYIDDLDNDFMRDYHVTIGNTISIFCDKFLYDLFDIYTAPYNVKTKIHEKKSSYGKAGEYSIGLKSLDVRFTLEERKIIKMISHYYVSSRGQETFKDDVVYIPFKQLKTIFSEGINHKVAKEQIIEACNRLNEKQIYWDFNNTVYKKTKDLKADELNTCNGDKLLEISIIYQIWGNNGNTTIKGILCRVNKWLRLRYSLNQIFNYYPTKCLCSKYLDFVVADKVSYHLKLKLGTKKDGYYLINLADLAKSIYNYKDNRQLSENYLSVMRNDKHKPRELKKMLDALMNVANYYHTNNNFLKCKYNLVLDNVYVPLATEVNLPRDVDDVYNELSLMVSGKSALIVEVNNICERITKLRQNGNQDTNQIISLVLEGNYKCKNKLIEYFKIASKTDSIDLERLRRIALQNIDTIKKNLHSSIERGNISLRIDYEK